MNILRLAVTIETERKIRGIEVPELAASMCFCTATYYNRLRNPKEFTVGELMRAEKKLGIKVFCEEMNRK